MKEIILYEPPIVEVIEVEVGSGFAGSDPTMGYATIEGYGPDSYDSEFGSYYD